MARLSSGLDSFHLHLPQQPLRHSLANSPVKGHVVNILDFVSHSVSVANAQVCMKYVNNVNNDEHGCVPIKLCGL